MPTVRGAEGVGLAGPDGWDGSRRTLGGLLAMLSRSLVADLHDRFTALGLEEVRPGSGNVFEHVDADGSMVATMAQRADISQQAMVQIVDYLEGRGYAVRTPDPRDRRAKLVRLTERGRETDETGRRLIGEIEADWAALVGTERFAAFRATLEELVAALDARRLDGV